MIWDFSLIIWSALVSPKIHNIGFGAQGHVRKIRNHENQGLEGLHTRKSKSYKFKLEQNNTTELVSIISFFNLPQNCPTYPRIRSNILLYVALLLCFCFFLAFLHSLCSAGGPWDNKEGPETSQVTVQPTTKGNNKLRKT